MRPPGGGISQYGIKTHGLLSLPKTAKAEHTTGLQYAKKYNLLS